MKPLRITHMTLPETELVSSRDTASENQYARDFEVFRSPRHTLFEDYVFRNSII